MNATKVFFKEFREWCKLNKTRECDVYSLIYFRMIRGINRGGGKDTTT